MRTVTLTLAAGVLVLGPLLAATLRDNRERIAAAQKNKLDPFEVLDLTCTLAHACAVRVDPTVTKAMVENIVDMENGPAVYAACWGATMPEPVAGDTDTGEAQQAGSLLT